MLVNIPRDKDDPNYRYKMPRLQSKIEGRGNGIKTNITNMGDIAKFLKRPPMYPTKFFGCELGAQCKYDESEEKALVNGAHAEKDLVEILDKFIVMYVLCPGCLLPEMDLSVKKGFLQGKCNACGHLSTLDMAHKAATYMLRNPPQSKTSTVISKSKKIASKLKKEKDNNNMRSSLKDEDNNNNNNSSTKYVTDSQVSLNGVGETTTTTTITTPQTSDGKKKKSKERSSKTKSKDLNNGVSDSKKQSDENINVLINSSGNNMDTTGKESIIINDNTENNMNDNIHSLSISKNTAPVSTTSSSSEIMRKKKNPSSNNNSNKTSSKKDENNTTSSQLMKQSEKLDFDSEEVLEVICRLKRGLDFSVGSNNDKNDFNDYIKEVKMLQLTQQFDGQIRTYAMLKSLFQDEPFTADAFKQHLILFRKAHDSVTTATQVLSAIERFIVVDLNCGPINEFSYIVHALYQEELLSSRDILNHYYHKEPEPGLENAFGICRTAASPVLAWLDNETEEESSDSD